MPPCLCGSPARDRLIAATIAAMPLVMPFYFDYDLLLLVIPAVLCVLEESRGSAAPRPGVAQRSRGILVGTWSALYLWLIINPDVAEQTRVNGAVVLLACLAGQLVARALRRDAETAQWAGDEFTTPAAGNEAPASQAAAA